MTEKRTHTWQDSIDEIRRWQEFDREQEFYDELDDRMRMAREDCHDVYGTDALNALDAVIEKCKTLRGHGGINESVGSTFLEIITKELGVNDGRLPWS